MTPRVRALVDIAVASDVVTGVGSWFTYRLELVLFGDTSPSSWPFLAAGYLLLALADGYNLVACPRVSDGR